tara:strand:- start:99 stop:509 length:411 start_codon:yes stop_codon:yes gene_type:complete
MDLFAFCLPYIIAVTIILLYSRFRCLNPEFKDPLEKPLFNIFDGWAISHFLLFTLVGYLHPDLFILALLFGILWELFESYSGKFKPELLNGWGNCHFGDKLTDNDGWWYGKVSDIFVNSFGYLLGQYLKTGKLILI